MKINLKQLKELINSMIQLEDEPDHFDKGLDLLKSHPYNCFMTALDGFGKMQGVSESEQELYITGLKHGIAFTYTSNSGFVTDLLKEFREKEKLS